MCNIKKQAIFTHVLSQLLLTTAVTLQHWYNTCTYRFSSKVWQFYLIHLEEILALSHHILVTYKYAVNWNDSQLLLK